MFFNEDQELLLEEKKDKGPKAKAVEFKSKKKALAEIKAEYSHAKQAGDKKGMLKAFKKAEVLHNRLAVAIAKIYGTLGAATGAGMGAAAGSLGGPIGSAAGAVAGAASGAVAGAATGYVGGKIDQAIYRGGRKVLANGAHKEANAVKKEVVAFQIQCINELKADYPQLEKKLAKLKKRDAKYSEDVQLLGEGVIFTEESELEVDLLMEMGMILGNYTEEKFTHEYYATLAESVDALLERLELEVISEGEELI